MALLGFREAFCHGHGEIGSHVVEIIDVNGAGRSLGTPIGAEDLSGTGEEDMYVGEHLAPGPACGLCSMPICYQSCPRRMSSIPAGP